MVAPSVGFLDRCHDRVLRAQGLGMELRMLVAEVLLELGVEAEPEAALRTLQRFHADIVAPKSSTRTGAAEAAPVFPQAALATPQRFSCLFERIDRVRHRRSVGVGLHREPGPRVR